jgi:hypothetical protein
MARYRTDQEWASIVDDFRSSGLSQVAFCRRRGLALSTFRPRPGSPGQGAQQLPLGGASPRRGGALPLRPRPRPRGGSRPARGLRGQAAERRLLRLHRAGAAGGRDRAPRLLGARAARRHVRADPRPRPSRLRPRGCPRWRGSCWRFSTAVACYLSPKPSRPSGPIATRSRASSPSLSRAGSRSFTGRGAAPTIDRQSADPTQTLQFNWSVLFTHF